MVNTASQPMRILVVDSDRGILQRIEKLYPAPKVEITFERSIERAMDCFESQTYQIMIFTSPIITRNQKSNLELLDIINFNCTGTQLLFLVYEEDLRLAHHVLQKRIFHYGTLPISDEELKMLIHSAWKNAPAVITNLFLKDEEAHLSVFEKMVGSSKAMQEVYRQIRQSASTDIPVLLKGETGTGKDLAAHAIHQLSSRSKEAFVPVHLGALPSNLLASQLFGHEKGAFTGATEKRAGAFEHADKGSIFLDEVPTMNDRVQVTLLRILENNEFCRIGSQIPMKSDVRIIAATNEDLAEAVHQGRFREDLFFRLDVIHIRLPALREREGDVLLLIDHFLDRFNQAFGKNIQGFSTKCISVLNSYDWPGNVRELKNAVQRAVVMCDKAIIEVEHLPQRLRQVKRGKVDMQLQIGMTLEEIEKTAIERTLKYCLNNRKSAAEMLGISRRTLYNKLHKYQIGN